MLYMYSSAHTRVLQGGFVSCYIRGLTRTCVAGRMCVLQEGFVCVAGRICVILYTDTHMCCRKNVCVAGRICVCCRKNLCDFIY